MSEWRQGDGKFPQRVTLTHHLYEIKVNASSADVRLEPKGRSSLAEDRAVVVGQIL